MSRIRNHQKGFTLVELLIVVIILGILAAIVIPQFTNASEDARKGSLSSSLQTLRAQVELYKLQHRDIYPTGNTGAISEAWTWDKLTGKTTVAGSTTAGTIGPYLQSESVNTFRSGSSPATGVKYISTELVEGDAVSGAAATDGWIIVPSGKIFALSKQGGYVYDESNPSAANNEN